MRIEVIRGGRVVERRAIWTPRFNDVIVGHETLGMSDADVLGEVVRLVRKVSVGVGAALSGVDRGQKVKRLVECIADIESLEVGAKMLLTESSRRHTLQGIGRQGVVRVAPSQLPASPTGDSRAEMVGYWAARLNVLLFEFASDRFSKANRQQVRLSLGFASLRLLVVRLAALKAVGLTVR